MRPSNLPTERKEGNKGVAAPQTERSARRFDRPTGESERAESREEEPRDAAERAEGR
jgi:hypothetical protein